VFVANLALLQVCQPSWRGFISNLVVRYNYIMEKEKPIDSRRALKLEQFDRLLTIMDELREQCPWDKKQTFETLRTLTIEETYELADAISKNDLPEVKKELGDLLLHVVFYARIGSETNDFDMADVIDFLCNKLIVRHPHIYGDVKAETEEDVKRNWEQIKLKEGTKSVLAGVPDALPALVKAMRIQEKARAAGFDWDEKEQVWDKVQEEMQEFLAETELAKAEAEFGDLLFSLVNYARFVGINPENALELTNRKFIKRFTYLETESAKDGKKLSEMTLPEMDEYWNKAKKL
jgi:XTP/dITP diphosphohydrolase